MLKVLVKMHTMLGQCTKLLLISVSGVVLLRKGSKSTEENFFNSHFW